ncbi:FecR domain-containing protein [Cohnella yongneupensis]|uniref:FecR domain-containing protein n=1 Tax=Cohnella yongneupensis TaxID=425006 RepID=A0ABW0R5K1_9BACL
MRKGFMIWLAILIVAVPLLGAFSKEAAAASSRVAVIKELKGTVKVKKAGGSKEFTAFAKMSLNEGDVLSVGSASSAVLQFANGTSEDDRMTIASNTKLTFSKLSSKKGTTTKVSMWSGSAWVDVKSITNADDQFTLETPTAVMGVRGTHLLVTVNPDTGATRVMVAAGVVRTTATGESGDTRDVYPTQNALVTDEGTDGDSEITIAPVDLAKLMQQGNAEIVRAILLGAADIMAENEHHVDQYENGEVPDEIGGTEADLVRFKANTENLLGALVNQALDSGLINPERLHQIIEEVRAQSGFEIDLSKNKLQLTDEEKAQLELQRKKEAEAEKLASDRKAKEEEDRKKNEEMLRLLDEARKAKQKADQEAEDAKKKKAKDEYESQLSDSEKKRFADDTKQREQELAGQNGQTPPSTTPGSSPSLSSGKDIVSFGFAQQIGTTFIDKASHSVEVTMERGTSLYELIANFELSSNAVAYIGDVRQTSGATPNDFEELVTYTVKAQNGTSQAWTVDVKYSIYTLPDHVSSWSVMESLDSALPRFVSEGTDEIGGTRYEYSVAVPELTSDVQLSMALANGTPNPDSVTVYDESANPVHPTYTNEGTGIQFTVGLHLNAEDAYTTYWIEYKMEDEVPSVIRFTILRGTPYEEELSLNSVAIGYSEGESFDATSYGENSFFAFAGPDTDGYSNLEIVPSHEHYQVFQWAHGKKVELRDWGMMGLEATLPLDDEYNMVPGWYDFEIVAWDRAMQQSHIYNLHIYRGMELPQPFADIGFIADNNTGLGAAFDNPTQWYLEVPGESGVQRIKPLVLPTGVQLEGAQAIVEGMPNSLEADADGYYSFDGIGFGGTINFTFSYGGHELVYKVDELPEMIAFSLNSVQVIDRTGFHYNTYSTVDIPGESLEASITLPNNITDVALKPFSSSVNPFLHVTIDGQNTSLDWYEYGSWNSRDVSNIGAGKSVEITIASPSGKTVKTYTLHLNRPPVEAGDLAYLYVMASGNPDLLDFGSNPVEISENTYFSSYRSNDSASFIMYASKTAKSGGIEVYLDEDSTPIPVSGGYYYLNDLAPGWHVAEIRIDDSLNSGHPTIFNYRIWVGEQPPADFSLSGIYAEDSFESLVDFQPVGETSKWTAEVDPDATEVGINPTLSKADAHIIKVVRDDGVEAEEDGGMYWFPLNDGNPTNAQLWVEYDGQVFVYSIEVTPISL